MVLEWLSGPVAAACVVTIVLAEMRDGGVTRLGCLSKCRSFAFAGCMCGGVVICISGESGVGM